MKVSLPILRPSEWFERHSVFGRERKYFAMYSSVAGGIICEPGAMMVPLDDHLVHRGDGIFEAMRIHERAIFDLDAHLQRLVKSAAAIHLELPAPLATIRDILLQTARAADQDMGTLRMFVSRGPGSFSVSPNDTVGTQLYVVVTDLHTPNLALYQKGVQVILSKTPQKPYPFAQIKSCNYLPNVLMKRESLAAGADFAVGVTGEGFLAEGPTENFFFIDSEQNFVYPNFDYTLAGTTLIRVAELAKTLVSDGMLKSVVSKNLTMADLRQAREGAMVGTTLGVLPIRDFAGVQWPAPGVVCTHLARLFKNELQSNEQIRTSWT